SHEDQGERYAAVGVPEQRIWYARAVPIAAFLGVMRIMGNINSRKVPPALLRYSFVGSRTKAYRAMADEYLQLDQSAADVRATRHKLNIPIVVLTAGNSR